MVMAAMTVECEVAREVGDDILASQLFTKSFLAEVPQ